MGSILSSLLGGGAAAEADEHQDSTETRVLRLHSTNRWKLHFNTLKDSNKLLVIDFSATWCGPCKFIEPAINDMASRFTDVEFAKIDVDELPDVSKEFKVRAMPTFVLCKQGNEVDRVVGAKKDELEKKVLRHQAS